MPELPEVETIRRGLAATVAGRRVESVEVLEPRSTRRHLAGPEDFCNQLAGRTLGGPRRRGKYLWFPIGPDALIAHLGMSGQFRVNPSGCERHRHTRVILHFHDDGPDLHFLDQRMFGGLAVSVGGADLPSEIAHIACDPLDDAFDSTAVIAKLRSKKSAIKRVLLDQTWMSGIGNIYADEALWRAKLHGNTPAHTLTASKARTLLAHVHDVLTEAIAAGGTSFDALYVNVNGDSGYFDRTLNAYGRTDLPCARCGTPIVREAFMNRSSFFCPRCQRLR